MACKPDFVQGLPPWMTIPLAPPLPTGSSCQPGPAGAKMALSCDARSLFGIAPGGACRAGPVARPAVGSYPTVSPLPTLFRLPGRRRSVLCGAFPGVAPAGRYPAPYLHGVRTFLDGCPPRSSSHPRERQLRAWRPAVKRGGGGTVADGYLENGKRQRRGIRRASFGRCWAGDPRSSLRERLRGWRPPAPAG